MRNPIILLALFCAACSSTTASLPTIRPYHMDIQQGNVVTPKMMMQLKPGMTKAQVRFVMGTPLISDSFHADRWDYFYSMQKDGHLIEQRRVILEFEKDALKHVRGDVIPAGSAGSTGGTQDKTMIPPTSIWEKKPGEPKEEEKGMLDKLKFWGDDKKPEQKPEPEAAPAAEQMAPVEPKPAAPVKPVEQPAVKAQEKLQEEKPQEQPAAAPQEEKKGLLDKLKFWGDKKDEPKQEAEPAPAPEPIAKPEPKPEPKAQPVSKPQADSNKTAPRQEEKGLLDRLKFWGDDKETPQPEPKAAPAAKPAPVRAPATEAIETKPVPKPVELPPEEDPSYFDRMLEKIGF